MAEKHFPSWLTEAEGFLLLQSFTTQLGCPYCAGTISWASSAPHERLALPLPCQSCRQAGVGSRAVLPAASEQELWAAAPGFCCKEDMTGYVLGSACSMCPVSLHSACSADLSAFLPDSNVKVTFCILS